MKKISSLQKIRIVYVPAAVGAVAVATQSFAMAWPPTSADVGSAVGDVVETIGGIFAAVVTAGLVLYGGVMAVQAGIGFFSKFVKRSTAG